MTKETEIVNVGNRNKPLWISRAMLERQALTPEEWSLLSRGINSVVYSLKTKQKVTTNAKPKRT
jgi:hypothetical protein